MKVIVTVGPSFEPIDKVRRLTNFSTGELGVLLSDQLARVGHDVFCFKGTASTFPGPTSRCQVHSFDTNDDLLGLLSDIRANHDIGAVFHVAALCDYKVKKVVDDQGRACESPKIETRSGAITLQLEPAAKVIARLRDLFPKCILVGWKYELVGTRDEALAKAGSQMTENRTDACVVNGDAYGNGFGFCEPSHPVHDCSSKIELVQYITTWLQSRGTPR